MARSSALTSPEITVCVSRLWFATSTRSASERVASSQIWATTSASRPMIEAMPTGRPWLKLLMSRERSITASSESRSESASDATAALNSPSEWPPKSRGRICRPTSDSFSRMALAMASEVVTTAGWVSVVSVSSSSLLSKQIAARSRPTTSLASANVARAAAERS